MIEPEFTQPRAEDEQRLYRFDNGFGASVIKLPRGPEVAVTVHYGPGPFEYWTLTRSPLGYDIIRVNDENGVQEILEQIRALDPALAVEYARTVNDDEGDEES